MTSWLLFGATEGGLFDLDATLPLMAVQVVLLTFILNALFFSPVGRVVEAEQHGVVDLACRQLADAEGEALARVLDRVQRAVPRAEKPAAAV